MHEDILKKEGFSVYIWEDAPEVYYPPHKHAGITAHIILEGEMDIIIDGKTKKYHVGDRFDIPAHTVHAARIGKQGCRYLIGEKIETRKNE